MEYKSNYTEEEIRELYKWFDEHKYENSIDIGHGLIINNVNMMVEGSRTVAFTKHENPTYSGQLHLLFQIKDAMIEQGKVK